jgi:hypothetical protein
MAAGKETIVIRVKLPGEGSFLTSGFGRRCIYNTPSGGLILRKYKGSIGEGTCRTTKYEESDDFIIPNESLLGTRLAGEKLVIETRRGEIEITPCEPGKKGEGCTKRDLREIQGYINSLIEGARVATGLSTLKHEEDVSRVLRSAAKTVVDERSTRDTIADLETRLRGLRGGRRRRSSKRLKRSRKRSSRRRV